MKCIVLSLSNKLRTWTANSRIIAAFMFGFTMTAYYALRYIRYAYALSVEIQSFEAYIWLASQPRPFCFLILGGLLLLSDAPFLTPLSQQEMLRIGRIKWIWTQIAYIFTSCLLYFSSMVLFSFLLSCVKVDTYLLGGWSNAIQILAFQEPDSVLINFGVSFPFPEMLQTLNPISAVFISVLFHSMYLALISLIILCVNLLTKANYGWVVGSCVHFIGYMIEANGGFGMNVKYSLLCCAMPGYQYAANRDMSPAYCFGVLTFSIYIIVRICRSNASKIEPF